MSSGEQKESLPNGTKLTAEEERAFQLALEQEEDEGEESDEYDTEDEDDGEDNDENDEEEAQDEEEEEEEEESENLTALLVGNPASYNGKEPQEGGKDSGAPVVSNNKKRSIGELDPEENNGEVKKSKV